MSTARRLLPFTPTWDFGPSPGSRGYDFAEPCGSDKRKTVPRNAPSTVCRGVAVFHPGRERQAAPVFSSSAPAGRMGRSVCVRTICLLVLLIRCARSVAQDGVARWDGQSAAVRAGGGVEAEAVMAVGYVAMIGGIRGAWCEKGSRAVASLLPFLKRHEPLTAVAPRPFATRGRNNKRVSSIRNEHNKCTMPSRQVSGCCAGRTL
jgi:hypothetical protein